MRAHYLTLTCLWLAACGDNGDFTPTDGARPDTVPPDTAPPVKSHVWFVGDALVDGQDIIGGFTHGEGTLPFGPGAEPPIRIPGAKAFDARGAKIAYVADTTLAGRFDLYVAEADGSNPVLVVQGVTGGATSVEISAVSLSPNGAKVAYTMDSLALDNGFDLHVVDTRSGVTPIKVSPDRAVGGTDQQDVFSLVTWSADSKYLAFSADMTANNFDQAYVVDTTAATPAAVELLLRTEIDTQVTGAQGVRGGLQFDAMNNIYFRARTVAGSNQFQLFRAPPTGAASRTVFALPPRNGGGTSDAGAFALSPDGSKIVFSADGPTTGQYDLYVSPVVNPTPTRLTTLAAAGNANFTEPMVFSPDGTKIAMVADFLGGDNNDEPFVVHLDGSTQSPRRLISLAATCPACTNVDSNSVDWTADGTALYVRGDITTSNDTRIFRVDPALADQAPTLVVTTPAPIGQPPAGGGDIIQLQVRAIP